MNDAKPPQLPFFVYGTLRRGQPNHDAWGASIAGSEPALLPGAALFDLGYFPLLARPAAGIVHGEVVRVRPEAYTAVLARLDALEGFDRARPGASLFRRCRCRVQTAADGTLVAWVYLVPEAAVRYLPPIPGGDWTAHLLARQDRPRQPGRAPAADTPGADQTAAG